MWSQQQFCLHLPHNNWFTLDLPTEYTDQKYESSVHDPENLKDMKWRIDLYNVDVKGNPCID